MNYQVGATAKRIKLDVGDVIKDEQFNASCIVDRIEDNIIHVSSVRYSHPYELTMFSLNLFKFMKKTLGVKKVNLNTKLGSFTVDKEDSERDLYRRLVYIWD